MDKMNLEMDKMSEFEIKMLKAAERRNNLLLWIFLVNVVIAGASLAG